VIVVAVDPVASTKDGIARAESTVVEDGGGTPDGDREEEVAVDHTPKKVDNADYVHNRRKEEEEEDVPQR